MSTDSVKRSRPSNRQKRDGDDGASEHSAMDRLFAAAQTIATARRTRTPLSELAPDVAPLDEGEAYLVQRAVHDLLLPNTGSLVGYKIGYTSTVMQD